MSDSVTEAGAEVLAELVKGGVRDDGGAAGRFGIAPLAVTGDVLVSGRARPSRAYVELP
ncbi:hypothetical protein [Streptomyces sp. NPDC054797]